MTAGNPPRSALNWRNGLLLLTVLLLAGGAYAYHGWILARTELNYRQCRDAQVSGKWSELQKLSEKWLSEDRRNADAWLFLADAAQHQGNFDQSVKALESIPESDPKFLQSLVAVSNLQFGALNRPFDGVKTCERLLKMEPRTTAAHQQLIEFYALTLQRRRLEHQIRFAIESSREPPTSYVYLFLIDTMRLDNGVESNEKWLKEDPDSELFQVARILQMPEPDSGVKSAKGDDKYTLADKLFERYPHNLELLAYKADLSIRRGNPDELMSLLMNLPGEADLDPRFWRAKGWLHLTRGETAKAKEALKKAIELFPLDWNARNWLADTLRLEGDSAAAEPLLVIVRKARQLRQQITAGGDQRDADLGEIALFAEQCGDEQVARALDRRLKGN